MQITAAQIAKILNVPTAQALAALGEAGINYKEERVLSEQEVDMLRTVLFRHYRPKQEQKAVGGGAMAGLPQEWLSYMEVMAMDKKIMIDTCSLMHGKCEEVFQQLIPLLKKYHNKVIIPVKVIDELTKHRRCTQDVAKCWAAEKGMRLCSNLEDAGCLSVRGSVNDNFADNVFFVVISNYRYKHQMTLVTQDRWLAYDVLQLNSFQSGGRCYPVEALYITDGGQLLAYDM